MSVIISKEFDYLFTCFLIKCKMNKKQNLNKHKFDSIAITEYHLIKTGPSNSPVDKNDIDMANIHKTTKSNPA